MTSHAKSNASDVAAKVIASMKQAQKEHVDDKKPLAPTESAPQQNSLVTHEVDLKQSLDESISQKLE